MSRYPTNLKSNWITSPNWDLEHGFRYTPNSDYPYSCLHIGTTFLKTGASDGVELTPDLIDDIITLLLSAKDKLKGGDTHEERETSTKASEET